MDWLEIILSAYFIFVFIIVIVFFSILLKHLAEMGCPETRSKMKHYRKFGKWQKRNAR